MKRIIQIVCFLIPMTCFAQYNENTSPDYKTLIQIYTDLAREHEEIELYSMGQSDYGLPIYLCVINGEQDSLSTFEKSRSGTSVLINNAIHPGEPDGVNACLIWIENWIKNGKLTQGFPVVGIIPAYNVGGMMTRSGTSRANQNGPEEYGFRGNAKNLDLNRDFIKMDSENMFTFAKIYHALDPDVFLDTHVSNGADYQYTMTYIASVKERMAPSLATLVHGEMLPYLKKESKSRGYELVPYVHLKGETPESGIQVFNDLPRYSMGYASLMNSISLTLETHMLKPFPSRVTSTVVFLESTIDWVRQNTSKIESARADALEWEKTLGYYKFNYKLTDHRDSILFKGFEFSHPKSEVTGLKRLKYHKEKPYEKYIPYFNEYKETDSVLICDFYVLGAQCKSIIDRLEANGIELNVLTRDSTMNLTSYQITEYSNRKKPYEGHYLHSGTKVLKTKKLIELKKGDVLIRTQQKNKRFLISVLEPHTPDSYFAWNYFDSYLQQKEYFSPYVFEDKAIEMLEENGELRKRFEEKKKQEKEFSESSWEQLYFIYKNSEYYEPSHNVIPINAGSHKEIKKY